MALQCFYDKGKSVIDLWSLAYGEVSKIKRACEIVGKDLPELPWFIHRSLKQLKNTALVISAVLFPGCYGVNCLRIKLYLFI